MKNEKKVEKTKATLVREVEVKFGKKAGFFDSLERANKEFGTNILFGDEVYTSLTKKLHSQSTLSGEVTLKGRAKPTKVYSI